jgi:formylglycine-generating enzyme required for sulfatase activity
MFHRAVDVFRKMGSRSKKILGGLVRVGLRFGVREVTEGLPVVGTVTRLIEELADFGVERLADARADVTDLKAAGDVWDAEHLAAVDQWLADVTASLQGLQERLEQALPVGDDDPWAKVAEAVEKAVEERQDLAAELAKVQKRLRKQTLSLHRIERQLSRIYQVEKGNALCLEDIKVSLVEMPLATEWRAFRQADPEGVRLLVEADRLILAGQREDGEQRLLDLLRRRGMGTNVIARHLGLHKLADGRLDQLTQLLDDAGVAGGLPAALTGTLVLPTTQRSRPLSKAWPCLPRGFVVAHEYRIEEEVGRGGMASVYRVAGVDDINRGKVYALKVPAPGLVDDQATAERFIQEIKLSMRLSAAARGRDPRPPLVPMFEYVRFEEPQTKRLLYGLVLKFVAGKSLARLLAERRAAAQPLTTKEIRRLMLPVCAALEFAHGQTPPLLHRDVKSPNVMVTPEGQALLMDFGIGRLLDDQSGRLTKTGTIAGTIGIMPPELLTPKATIDERVDVYMLGKLLGELMTFDLTGDPEQRCDCPKEWVTLIDDATSQRPGKRPRTVRAFAERLSGNEQMMPPPVIVAREPGDIIESHGIKFAWIPPDTFFMGSPTTERGRSGNERQHWVTITQGFYLGIHPVTRGQFRRFVDANGYHTEAERGGGARGWTGSEFITDPKFNWKTPGYQQDNDHPVVCITHNDAVAYCQWLSRCTGHTVRLPTESQWEFACRCQISSGRVHFTPDAYHFGNTITHKDGNFQESRTCAGNTTKVGSFPPNGLGLFDIHGNVWEWCWDWYGEYPVADQREDAISNPEGPPNGSQRVLRGGSCFIYTHKMLRAAQRWSRAPGLADHDYGLRVAILPSGT